MKEYFSHDHNARNDPKIVALVDKYKSSGYGIFWATSEMMHEEGGELELTQITYKALAKHLNEDITHIQLVIKDCVEIFLLYLEKDNKLISNRVSRNLTRSKGNKLSRTESGRLGGIKSGESRKLKQNEAPLEAESKHRTIEKESIEKNRKESIDVNSDFVCYDAEYYILNSSKALEKICIATGKGSDIAKKELHNYHLWMIKKQNYPTTEEVVKAGFETWLLNGYDYKNKYQVQNNLNGVEQPKIKLK